MNPVPEIDEDLMASSHQIDDPFAKAPMTKINLPQIHNLSNSEILKPIQLYHNQPTETNQQLINFGPSSPVHDTNPWAADARLHVVDTKPSIRHQRTPSEADEWLKKIEKQANQNQFQFTM